MGSTTPSDIADSDAVMEERRSPLGQARADRLVGHWIAGRLGMTGHAADRFAAATVAAGARSTDGRGGFDHLVASIGRAGVGIEELRIRYMMAKAGAELPVGFFPDARHVPACA